MHRSRLASSVLALTLGLTLSAPALAAPDEAGLPVVEAVDGRRFVVVDGKLVPLADGDKVAQPKEKSTHGLVGSLTFASALGLGSSGSESERACDALGSQCTASPALGGGLFVSLGYQWKYLGFDVLGGGSFDAGARRYADAQGTAKSYTVERLSGLTALRLRGQLQSENFRAALALGPGLVWRAVGHADRVGVPLDATTYNALALTGDFSLQWRAGASTAIALGAMAWLDNAGDNVTTARGPSEGRFHLVSGPQATLMPYLGFQFGP